MGQMNERLRLEQNQEQGILSWQPRRKFGNIYNEQFCLYACLDGVHLVLRRCADLARRTFKHVLVIYCFT